jgi:hypothetical protein
MDKQAGVRGRRIMDIRKRGVVHAALTGQPGPLHWLRDLLSSVAARRVGECDMEVYTADWCGDLSVEHPATLSPEARDLLLDLRTRMHPREYEELVQKIARGDQEFLAELAADRETGCGRSR